MPDLDLALTPNIGHLHVMLQNSGDQITGVQVFDQPSDPGPVALPGAIWFVP